MRDKSEAGGTMSETMLPDDEVTALNGLKGVRPRQKNSLGE